MKGYVKRFLALLLVFVMMMSMPSQTVWAAPGGDDVQASVSDIASEQAESSPEPADAVIEAYGEEEVKDAIEEAIFQSREVTAVDVSKCGRTEAEMHSLTNEVLEENKAESLVNVTYETNAENRAATMNVERDDALIMALDELDEINASSAETLNSEEMKEVYAHYAELQTYYEGNPDYWGVAVNYFSDKNTEASPVGAIISIAGMDPENPNIQVLDQTIQGIYQALQAYVQYYGADLLKARDKALASIDDKMSTVEKLLVLHDYMGTHVNFDMTAIMDMVENGSGGSDLIMSTPFGALVTNSCVCLGYTATYAYLVQCAFPEIYKNQDGSWKTKDELKDTYMVDYAMIKYDQEVSFGDQTILFNEPHYFNVVKVDGQWYYIDSCYDDISQEAMQQNRVETDGDDSHMFVLYTQESFEKWYEGTYEYIDSAYKELCTDDQYEEAWFSTVSSPICYDDENWYYVDTQMNYGDMMDYMNGTGSRADDDISGFMKPELLIARNRETGEKVTLFNYDTAEVTAVSGEVVTNEALEAECTDDDAYVQIYPALRHAVGLYDNKLYFNLSNKIQVMDLSTRTISQFKEYNDVYAASNGSRFTGMSYYSVDKDFEDIVFSVSNHPVGSICIKDDGKMYVSIATNYSYATDPTYSFEETNYNPSYIKYGDNNEGENNNDEFYWCANIVDTMEMDKVTGAHNYETVTVAPFCTKQGFDELRCTDCGGSDGTQKTNLIDAIGHHYIYDEVEAVYLCSHCYAVSEQLPEGAEEGHSHTAPVFNWTQKGEGYACTAVFSCEKQDDTRTVNCVVTSEITEGSCEEEHTVTYTAAAFDVPGTKYTETKTATASAGEHSYGEPAFVWADDNSCKAEITCSECGDVTALDCKVTNSITAPTCTSEGTAVYTATVTIDEKEYTDYKVVALPKNEHTYGDPIFTWTEDNTSCTAVFTCSECGTVRNTNCSVTSETKDAVCTEGGFITYTAECVFQEKEYKDTKMVEISATGHSYGEPAFTWRGNRYCTAKFTCSVCGDVQTVNCNVKSSVEDGYTVYSATCTFEGKEYQDIPLAGITLDKNEVSIVQGKTEILTVVYHPANTTGDKNITWTSSDDKIATVEDGMITAVSPGEAAITAKVGDKTAVCSVTVTEPEKEPLMVSYSTHVQNDGWQSFVSDGELSGTSGKGLRLEAIQVKLENNELDGGVEYRTHVQNIGWQDYVGDGAISGTSGESLRLEAIQIRLTGAVAEQYDIYYRTHIQDIGWLGWAKNDGRSGSEGLSKRLEAIEIVLVEKGGEAPGTTDNTYITPEPEPNPTLSYVTHVQNIGWQDAVGNGELAGTEGKSLRLEGIRIRVDNDGLEGSIEYRTHVQNDGWQDWVQNNDVAGTEGRNLRLEAIEIRLTGKLAETYDIVYRTHVQNDGWQDWVQNGALAGTSGRSLRLEAIEIKLVKK